MIIVHDYLDKQKFLDDLSYLYYRQKEKLQPYIGSINKLLDSDRYVLHFLMNVDDIKDARIQSACRRVAIAWMYGAGVDENKCDKSSSWHYYISYCSNELAVIEIHKSFQSTALISKDGNILVDEGKIRLNGRNHYPEGWVARRIVDGKETGEEGVYSNDGKVAIPFGVFDSITFNNDGLNTAVYKIQYKDNPWSLQFIFHVKDIARASKKELMDYLEYIEESNSIAKERIMFLISPDQMIIHLNGPMDCNPDAALLYQMEEELTTKLDPLTRAIIQKELDQRND